MKSETKSKIIYEANRVIRRSTRWFIRNRTKCRDIQSIIKFFVSVRDISKILPNIFEKYKISYIKDMYAQYIAGGVKEDIALHAATFSILFPSLEIIDSTITNEFLLDEFSDLYYRIGIELGIEWFRSEINGSVLKSHWDALARSAFRDSLDLKQREITTAIMQMKKSETEDINMHISSWMQKNNLEIKRWRQMVSELKSVSNRDFTMYSVVLRDLMNIVTIYEHKV